MRMLRSVIDAETPGMQVARPMSAYHQSDALGFMGIPIDTSRWRHLPFCENWTKIRRNPLDSNLGKGYYLGSLPQHHLVLRQADCDVIPFDSEFSLIYAKHRET